MLLSNASNIFTPSTSSESEKLLLMPTWAYHLAAAYLIIVTVLGLVLNGCFLVFILRDPKVFCHTILYYTRIYKKHSC